MASLAMQIVKWPLITVGLAVAVVLFIEISVEAPAVGAMVEFLVTIVAGWLFYVVRVTTHVQFHWGPAACAAACAIALVIGTHRFLQWLSREMNRGDDQATTPKPIVWRARDTFRGFAPLLLIFVAGVAIVGIAHQAIWLATSHKPIFHNPPRSGARVYAGNLDSIGLALADYAKAHNNQYPADLAELIRRDCGVDPRELVCRRSSDTPAKGRDRDAQAEAARQPGHCSYLYFGKGHTSADVSMIIALDPPAHHEDAGITVLFGDGHVEWIDIDKAGDILLQHGFERIDPARTDYSPALDAKR